MGKICSGVLLLAALIGGDAFGASWFKLKRDYRKCAFPMCGGYFLETLNRPEFCGTRRKGADEPCYVAQLDLSKGAVSRLPDHLDQVIVKGSIVPGELDVPVDYEQLVVENAWRAPDGQVDKGRYFHLYDNGIRCITTPCASVSARLLNKKKTVALESVVFAGGDPGLTIDGEGVLVTGKLRRRRGLIKVFSVYSPVGQIPCSVPGLCGDQDRVGDGVGIMRR